jgi:beta-galactosidase
LFATYVWNMFDFGADARAEGGEPGQNHKGLVTFDRRYKKDAFYAYKAWLSDEPFVHICGKRYVDRVEPLTRVTVYSNLPEVELIVNGKSVGKKKAPDHFFRFDIRNDGESKLTALAGQCRDEGFIRKVDKFNERYLLREHSPILNWFDITEVAGHLSVKDRICDIMATEEGARLLEGILRSGASFGGFEMNESMREMMGSFTLIRLVGMLGAMGVELGREELLDINSRLNKIKKA